MKSGRKSKKKQARSEIFSGLGKSMEDQVLTVIFEGDACRGWIAGLSKRIHRVLAKAENDKVILTTYWHELQEMRHAATALRRAENAMARFHVLTEQVEGTVSRRNLS
jgi:hypothetical protein